MEDLSFPGAYYGVFDVLIATLLSSHSLRYHAAQVVVEFEGVVVEDTSDVHSKAWVQLAEDEGKSRPLQFALKRAEGMKNDQVRAPCLSR